MKGHIKQRNIPLTMFNDAQPEDLLTDDSFLAWYHKTNPEDQTKWDNWIGQDQQRMYLVQQAIDLMETLHVTEKEVQLSQLNTAENNIMEAIDSHGHRPFYRIPNFIWMAAASIILLVGSFFIIKSFFHTRPAIQTNYGEIREQRLPDGTDVKLNANSKVSYADAWTDGHDREVWVTGEAFFHVSKTPKKSRFIVHTDHFNIIVTGTQFNVVNRNGQSNVMLHEGSVIVKDEKGGEINMIPGDFVEFAKTGTQKRIVRNDSVLAWRDNRLIFDNTPISRVLVIIKDHYGVDVKAGDMTVGDKTVSGMLPNDNLDVLLQSIDATNDLEVVHHGDEISIKVRQ